MIDNATKEQQKEKLKEYLSQYFRAKRRKEQLDRRMMEIREEFNCPITGINYSAMPKGSGISAGAATIVLKLADIEEQIIEQHNSMAQTMILIMDALDFLENKSMEREVLEYRYLDCYGWEKICEIIPMSYSRVMDYWNKGLDILMDYKKINVMVNEWVAKRERSEKNKTSE